MNVWANAVITKKGVALQSKLTQGNTLKITKAVTGTGYVSPTLLQNQTAVTGIKQTLTFNTVSYPTDGTCAMPVRLGNDGLSAGYTAKQVGIYATDPDDGEILYFISQVASNDKGIEIPSATEMPGYGAEWIFYFKYGQADGVTVTVNPSNTVTPEEAQVMVKDYSFPRNATIVGINSDLNDYTDVGVYTYSAAAAETMGNVPEKAQGTLLVLPRLANNDPKNIIQTVITRENRIFTRNRYDGTWKEWERAATLTELNDHGRHIPDTCTTIEDWNNAVKTGWYMGHKAANGPSETWYFGFVIAHAANYVLQEVYNFTNSSTKATDLTKFIRSCYNGTWTSWINVTIQRTVPESAKLQHTVGLTGDAQLQLDNKMPLKPSFIEMTPSTADTHGGYLDFHYAGASDDYTTRIIEAAKGLLHVIADTVKIKGVLQISGGDAGLYGDDHTVNLVTKSDMVNDYKRSLQIMNKAYEADIADAIILIDKDSAGARNYKLYGEHNKPTPAAIGAARVSNGSYTGTGAAGSSNPNTLTFDFQPQLVVIVADSKTAIGPVATFFVRGQTGSPGITRVESTSTADRLTISWSGNTVSWYDTAPTGGDPNSGDQLNDSGVTYRYCAIG